MVVCAYIYFYYFMDVDVHMGGYMRKEYTIEIDVRDFQMLDMYRMGLEEKEMNEVDGVIRDILWQIITQEEDRRREQGLP